MRQMDEVLADVEYGFSYDPDRTYQDRAHEYMRERGLMRDGTKTATLVEVEDLVRRAYEVGRQEASEVDVTPQAMELVRISGELFKMATDLKNV